MRGLSATSLAILGEDRLTSQTMGVILTLGVTHIHLAVA